MEATEGAKEGTTVGVSVGEYVGESEGTFVGVNVGETVGKTEGFVVGSNDGIAVVGLTDGATVPPDIVGARVTGLRVGPIVGEVVQLLGATSSLYP